MTHECRNSKSILLSAVSIRSDREHREQGMKDASSCWNGYVMLTAVYIMKAKLSELRDSTEKNDNDDIICVGIPFSRLYHSHCPEVTVNKWSGATLPTKD